jgi:GlpG protein
MRVIGHIDDEVQARSFADFLFVRGIENLVEFQKGEGWAVWISEEDQLGPAGKLLEQFRANPKDAQYQKQARNADQMRAQEDKTQEEYRKKVTGRRQLFRPLTGYGFGPLTFALITASSIVFLLSRLGTDFAPIHGLFISETMGGNRQIGSMLAEVRHGQVWRLFTPAFIHMSFAHLLLNMLWLRDLGSMIEARQGTLRLAALVTAIAAVSNVAEYYATGPAFGGMSGVVYGLLGYVWIRGKLDPASGLFLHSSTVVMMLAWFVLCYTPLLTPLIGHVANTVHAAGLLLGMAWGFFSSLSRR